MRRCVWSRKRIMDERTVVELSIWGWKALGHQYQWVMRLGLGMLHDWIQRYTYSKMIEQRHAKKDKFFVRYIFFRSTYRYQQLPLSSSNEQAAAIVFTNNLFFFLSADFSPAAVTKSIMTLWIWRFHVPVTALSQLLFGSYVVQHHLHVENQTLASRNTF